MEMAVASLVILVVGVWRMALFFVEDGGPFGLSALLREKIGVSYDERNLKVARNDFAKIFCCVSCMSFWTGVAVAGLYLIKPDLTLLLALPFCFSGFAIFIESRLA